MTSNIKKHIKPLRFKQLPDSMRLALKEARLKRGLSQIELGKMTGLPQMHISGIETGKIVPRFDTLLDLVRVLDFDLLLVPRHLVPVVTALSRQNKQSDSELSLYADNNNEIDSEHPHDEV